MRLKLTFLSDDEIQAIHHNSLRLLENVGVNIDSEKARNLLAAKGAKVCGDNVRFPKEMVTETLRLANANVTLTARNDAKSVRLPAVEFPYCTTSGYVPYVIDEGATEYRLATAEDLRVFSVLSDYYDEFGFFWPVVLPQDVPAGYQEYKAVEVAFSHTGKHIQASVSNGETAEYQIELAALIAGGKGKLRERPVLSLLAAPLTPLCIKGGIADAIVCAARHGIPVVPMSLPQMGTTSPATAAANTLLANTEVLSCYMLAKCADELAPVIYASDTGAPNLRTLGLEYNNPEFFILSAGNADMARFYNLPGMVGSGMSEEKDYSTVFGFERNVLKHVIGLLNRTDISCFFGTVGGCMAASPVECILDVEAYKYAKAYLRSYELNDYKLAYDVIAEIGPQGNFLQHKHTHKNLREEIFTGRIEDSCVFGENYRERAAEKLKTILSGHKVPPIEEKLAKEIEALSKKAYDALGE